MAHLQVKRWAQYQHEDERRRSQKKETKIKSLLKSGDIQTGVKNITRLDKTQGPLGKSKKWAII